MKWKTSISTIQNGEEIIRGEKLENLVKEQSFSSNIYFLLTGKKPTKEQIIMMDALLSVAIDHGAGTASAMTTRIVTSTKNSMHTAVAAGILAMGELHGSAIEGAARFFQENNQTKDVLGLVRELKNKKVRIPGFGHAVLEHDKRADLLYKIAKEQGIFRKNCIFSLEVYEALNSISSKKLPINIDGAMGAIISDMEFDWKIAKGFFMIARVPGLVAQAYEEQEEGNGIRRLQEENIEYIGD